MVRAVPSIPSIEIVKKCCGPQNHSHIFGFGGGVKARNLKGGTLELLQRLNYYPCYVQFKRITNT
ncbi:hypothetical protein RDI58_026919 [Solanum bulbocastanum]|uniref:Uncharacterized protein n=1 Tax=Solanum bulbocastanum TaxID=147425 RepID=A0AAN8Y3T3_SOLBU